MKITASRRDDILKQREEYDAETRKMTDIEDSAEERYERTLYDQQKSLEKKISDAIGATTLELVVQCHPYGRFSADTGSWSVTVKANDSNKFEANVALAWSWDAEISADGEIKKDSGSWSGLKACTAEQIADLEESVRVIKILNSLDWITLLRSPKARYSDFHDKDLSRQITNRRAGRPNFEDQLDTVELEDSIGSNTVYKLSQDQYYNGKCGIIVTGVSDKFVKGYIFPWGWADGSGWTGEKFTKEQIIDKVRDTRRTSKSNLVKEDGQLVSAELA